MKESFYGHIEQSQLNDALDLYVEEVRINGFTVIDSGYSKEYISKIRDEVYRVYDIQKNNLGEDYLEQINETDLCRFCLKYSELLIKPATHPQVISIARKMLGDWIILNLQNAIINKPEQWHHQRSWHRDLPHQNFVSSQPLAINALWAIDEFNEQTGGTIILPYSHNLETLPSDEYINRNKLTPNVKAGQIIIFNSMLFHKAGNNTSQNPRISINHIYTRPILKQQYDISGLPEEIYKNDDELKRLLGVDSAVAKDDIAWRKNRMAKFNGRNEDGG